MAEKKRKKKLTKIGKIIMDIILVISLGVAIYSGYRLYKGLHEYKQATTVVEGFKDEYVAAGNMQTPEEITIDWEGLKKANPDIVGWIKLEDSYIDFPIVQGSDNEYYLYHLLDGTYNWNGTIFMDANNASTFTDRNTVIYGHHLLYEPWMFADLYQYKSQDYYSTHKEIYIYTPEKDYIAYPIAGIYQKGTDSYIKYTFVDNDEFLSYVRDFVNQSTFVSDEQIYEDDKIILLSTCEYEHNDDGRYALIAKLVEKGE